MITNERVKSINRKFFLKLSQMLIALSPLLVLRTTCTGILGDPKLPKKYD